VQGSRVCHLERVVLHEGFVGPDHHAAAAMKGRVANHGSRTAPVARGEGVAHCQVEIAVKRHFVHHL
jgi:hypothetical protein